MTIVDVYYHSPPGRAARRYEIGNREQVAYLVDVLLREVQRNDPLSDKCFEGWAQHHKEGHWYHVVFTTPDGKEELIWMPEGDCQVWPSRLPWGWSYSGSTFANRVYALTHPIAQHSDLLSYLERDGWEPIALIDYPLELWRRHGENPRWYPSIAEGDFNGDGRADLAALLRKGEDVKLSVVHATPTDHRMLDLSVSKFRNGFQQGYDGYSVYLRPCKPGTVPYWRAGGKTGQLKLQHDGFEVCFLGKAASLYYWDGNGYSSVVTGD